MMLITAVVAPSRVEYIRQALGLFGVHGMTMSRTYVIDRLGGRRTATRQRTRIEILAANADTPDLVRVLARTLTPGDRVWATPLDFVVRIRTGESGLAAID